MKLIIVYAAAMTLIELAVCITNRKYAWIVPSICVCAMIVKYLAIVKSESRMYDDIIPSAVVALLICVICIVYFMLYMIKERFFHYRKESV